jgi:hypothetical protein
MKYGTKPLFLALIYSVVGLFGSAKAAGGESAGFDLALVLAVDLSDSINPSQYQLQMAGIAQAFEDKDVQSAILSGQHGAILVTLVAWSDKPQVAIPWTPIGSTLEAVAFGEKVRGLPRFAGNFTCMARALQFVEERVLPQQPAAAERQIVDVSGDGRENCNPTTPLDTVRARLVGEGVTINGLAILEGKEADRLEQWYADNVIGGPFSFVLPAEGYGDFARSMRRKFIVEISMASTALVEP